MIWKNRTKEHKGFTLAELLIVVAIIAVIVAIAIPIFTSEVEKSREAADMANIRSAYAEVSNAVLADEAMDAEVTVDLTQTKNGWQTEGLQTTLESLGRVIGEPEAGGVCTVTFDPDPEDPTVVFNFGGGGSGGGSGGDTPSTPEPASAPRIPENRSNPAEMSRTYGEIVSYLYKENPMPRTRSRYDYYGNGSSDDEKVMIITSQTGDGQTINEVKTEMKNAGYSDADVDTIFSGVKYAYLDKDGNLLGYNGPGAGGMTQLYIVGYDKNPVSVGGCELAKAKIAEFVQDGTVTP